MDNSVERWAGASFYKYHKKLARHINRWFELHPNPERLRSGWLGWAIENQCVCDLQEPHPELNRSSAYPIAEITSRFGRYFTSTASYMIASAIHAGASKIFLCGIDMRMDHEYVYQRPCLEYIVGVARGMGIQVLSPIRSSVLQSEWLYGYERPEDGYRVPKNLIASAHLDADVA
jgi:hypothetical protein